MRSDTVPSVARRRATGAAGACGPVAPAGAGNTPFTRPTRRRIGDRPRLSPGGDAWATSHLSSTTCTRRWRACCHPVCRSADVAEGAIVRIRLLGEDWAVARIDGEVVALADRCPHRGSPLSAGCVVDGTVHCAYHGFRFAGDGHCVEIPALGAGATIPPKANVRAAARASPSATASCGWHPSRRWPRSSTCRSGTTRRSSSPRCPTRSGTPGRPRWSTTSSTSPTSRSPTSARSAIPTTSRCRRTRSSGMGWRSRATTSTRRSDWPTRWAPPSSRWRRGARRGGTSPRSRSGCASTTRPTTSC